MSSSIGNNLKVTLFGESHGEAIGCIVDGYPAGQQIDIDAIAAFMARRAPGQGTGSTTRKEADTPHIISGIHNGKTTGAPITCLVQNTNTRSQDYSNLDLIPRPGHADYALNIKTDGNNDIRGGGHSSGRIMAGTCFAGALAIQNLRSRGITIKSEIDTIGPHKINGERDAQTLDQEARDLIENARLALDSIGGTIRCEITGVPAGYGEPIFDGVENRLAHALFGIPAVKGVEFGSGFEGSTLLGSQNNDNFTITAEGKTETLSNNHGGILGGITSGMPITFRIAVKPTPSIGKPQQSINLTTKEIQNPHVIKGRHDSCIVPRALPIVEAIAAIIVLDLLLDPPPQGK